MNEKSSLHVKLNVKPVVVAMFHINAYQGPCRYGEGYSLTYEYDKETADRHFEAFREELKTQLNHENVTLLEPVLIHWNEDFNLRDSEIDRALEEDQNTDFYLIRGLRMSAYLSAEISRRSKKPVGLIPEPGLVSKCDHVDLSAYLHALGRPVYAFRDFDDVNETMELLRVKKAVASTRALFPLKSAMVSFGCLSSYINLTDITDRFGLRFVHLNAEDVFKALDGLSDEEKASARQLADELVQKALGVHMPKENIYNDAAYYTTVKKLLVHYGCNAFAIPCFEVCATMELMRRKLTFCLTHALLRDEGIVSVCAGDAGSVAAMAILMNLTKKSLYMGNTFIADKKKNLGRILHDSACRYMKGYDKEPLPVEYVSFTLSNWGSTMRHDFSKDTGEAVTLMSLSPDMKKMMLVKSKIVGGQNYLVPECMHACDFSIEDPDRFHECQQYVGHHMVLTYGDYTKKLKKLAKEYGLEVLEA